MSNIQKHTLEDMWGALVATQYIIQDRALPDIQDGLKPVGVAVPSMNKDTFDKSYRKSARISQ